MPLQGLLSDRMCVGRGVLDRVPNPLFRIPNHSRRSSSGPEPKAPTVVAVPTAGAVHNRVHIVGLLSGRPPVLRALRQLLIGYGAATITYLVGLLFGTGLG